LKKGFLVIISFKTDDLLNLCQQNNIAIKKLGKDATKKLHARLTNLYAADVVTDLVAGRPHPLKYKREGQFALNISKRDRLVFISDHEPLLLDTDNKTDWNKVSKIKIIFIGDYHD
jgi:proteic killer suppression protein